MCVVAKRMLEDICPTSCVLLRNMDVWRHRVDVLFHASPKPSRHPLKLYQMEVAIMGNICIVASFLFRTFGRDYIQINLAPLNLHEGR